MSYFYLVQEGSKAHEDLIKVDTGHKDWFKEDIKKQIVDIIGYDYGSNFVCEDRDLYLLEHKVGPGIRNQFLKNVCYVSGVRMLKARKNSKIFKEYSKICKENNLKYYSMSDFRFTYLSSFDGFTIHRLDKTKYVFEFKREQKDEFLIPISEKEYLEMKLETLEDKE